MTSNEKLFADMRIAELHAAAESQRLARQLRGTTEPMPRWSIIRLIRAHRPVAAA
jgi:hypothetical protein